MRQPYQPIACSLHDELEALATLRRECRIAFRGEEGKTEMILDVIADIFTHGREEFFASAQWNGCSARSDYEPQ